MMNKKTSAEQMYKEYISSVGADKAAIDDILSGEKQSSSYGAHIKHTHGKWAAVGAAAAVMAVCTGIGLSNLGTNNESTSPAASKSVTSAPAVTTAQQTQVKPPEKAAVSLTAKPIAVSEKAFAIRVTLTANTEDGKKLLAEKAAQITCNLNTEKDGMIASAGTFIGNDKLDGNDLNLRLYGNIFNKRIETVPVEVMLPSDIADALGVNATTTVFLKKTTNDKVYVSKTGESFRLSDSFATTDHNYSTQKCPPVTFKLKDGSEISTREDVKLVGSGGNTGNEKIRKQYSFFFDGKFPVSTDDVASIIYDGIEFKPAKQGNEKFKTELISTKASDHGMIATVKLTALNDEAKKYLNKDLGVSYQASNDALMNKLIGCHVEMVSDNTLIANVCFAGHNENDKVANGDTVTAVFRLPDNSPGAPDGASESTASALAAEGRHIEITINKNKKERTLRSKDGKTLFLSDFHLTAHNIRSTISAKNITVKYADGTTLTQADIGMLGGSVGTPDNKGTSATIYFEKDIAADKVVSVTFNGTQYTVQ
ncbi:MAG: hypothetical protein IKH90_06120 [Ruminococcus sp.]|nr:hypothetical protein [Ruminococcus sp.]